MVLLWEKASGNFDVLHYCVKVTKTMAGGTATIEEMNTTATFISFPIMPGVNYLTVGVSTVSKCGQVSHAAVPENSMNGFVSFGKYLNSCIVLLS